MIRPAQHADFTDWAQMRAALWPEVELEVLAAELTAILANPNEAAFVDEGAGGRLRGFIEASLRSYAEGCDTAPIGYIEGWYVEPEHRRRGVGGALVRAAEGWARSRGCRWMGSDALFANTESHLAHAAIGYLEVDRLVHFARRLGEPIAGAPGLRLTLLPETYAIIRMPQDAPLPAWAFGPFVSITRTADELSVVCPSGSVPSDVHQEPGWRCLRIAGTLDFGLVGVLASLVTPLAAAGVSVFTISTFDTDYLLVREAALELARSALHLAGHQLTEQHEATRG